MRLGLGQGLGAGQSSGGLTIVRDGLVMQHKYNASAVQPLSDGAAYCDGSTYVDCGTGIGTALGDNYAGDLTVSMWFKANATTGVGLFQSGNESHNNREFSLRLNSNKLEFGLNNISWQKTVAFTDTSNWHHVVAVLDNGSESTSLLYLDGVSVGSVEGGSSFPTASNLDFNGDDTHIGRFYNSEFNGYICNVGMWTRVLTQAEIKSIMFKQYADLTTSEKTSLVSFWNLDSTVADGIPLVYDENNTTLGPDLWSITDPIGPDTLGGADGDKNASMDLSDVGLADGDVIKLSATISGSNGGRILAPDVGAGTNGVTRIPSDADYQHTEDGDIEVYMYVSDITGVLKIRTDHDAGASEDDRTQKISNIKVQKVTNAGRLA